jgi:2C-methyl-D-erythritol 2,4-cyclodiphosphate synthase
MLRFVLSLDWLISGEVLLHTVVDAVLGALCLPDIGNGKERNDD